MSASFTTVDTIQTLQRIYEKNIGALDPSADLKKKTFYKEAGAFCVEFWKEFAEVIDANRNVSGIPFLNEPSREAELIPALLKGAADDNSVLDIPLEMPPELWLEEIVSRLLTIADGVLEKISTERPELWTENLLKAAEEYFAITLDRDDLDTGFTPTQTEVSTKEKIISRVRDGMKTGFWIELEPAHDMVAQLCLSAASENDMWREDSIQFLNDEYRLREYMHDLVTKHASLVAIHLSLLPLLEIMRGEEEISLRDFAFQNGSPVDDVHGMDLSEICLVLTAEAQQENQRTKVCPFGHGSLGSGEKILVCFNRLMEEIINDYLTPYIRSFYRSNSQGIEMAQCAVL